jgi:short subunit dehydrogenase-like uncharacterized protein
MRLAVYGATGSIGRMVSSELERRGIQHVVGGRDRDALAQLARNADTVVDVRPARPDDQPSLRALLDGCEVVINCAPASLTGESLIRGALDAGTHYLDAAGEQAFIRAVFERNGEEAERRGVVIAPALGFDYALGDCLARLTADGNEPLRELVIAYALSGTGVSRDSLDAAGRGEPGEEVVYEDGSWRPAPQGVRRISFRFPPPIELQPMQRYGSGEAITVPRHTRTDRVTTLITASTWAPHPRLIGLMPYLRPLAAGVRRSPLRKVLRLAARPGPSERDERSRDTARFTIAAMAHGADGSVGHGLVEGSDFYELTAVILAFGACGLAASKGLAGALAPSAVLEPKELLGALEEWGVSWSVE